MVKGFNRSVIILITLVLLLVQVFHALSSNNYEELAQPACNGSTIGECSASPNDEELSMESEISRRILAAATQKYIAYNGLHNDQASCLCPGGHSYSGCCLSAQANKQTRGCPKIKKCRDNSHNH
ncbi:hypothetical protein AQUCO_03400080v1 [Aquilegia coerulea]|uniref:Uncharacterized protein n=1 Tax=Aquilegia coerulea TaxID=218851 RepID=A0A2G5CXJ2_AQUCA|nr:hypothetical protein AQUCO_03400080v1 [Aquilegia coerulea]